MKEEKRSAINGKEIHRPIYDEAGDVRLMSQQEREMTSALMDQYKGVTRKAIEETFEEMMYNKTPMKKGGRMLSYLIEGPTRKVLMLRLKRLRRYSTASQELRRIRLSKKIEKQLVKNWYSSKYGRNEITPVLAVEIPSAMIRSQCSLVTYLLNQPIHPFVLSGETFGSSASNVTTNGNLVTEINPNLLKPVRKEKN